MQQILELFVALNPAEQNEIFKQLSKIMESNTAVVKRRASKNTTGKPKKDPNAPKGAKNGFMYFSQQRRAELKAAADAKGEKQAFAVIAKQLGDEWTALPEAEKKPYMDLAVADKIRAKAEKEAYAAANASTDN